MTKVLKIYTRLILALVPFFFLPMIYDSFGLGKSVFLVVTGVIGVILWIVSLLTEKTAKIKYTKWLWWVLILFGWALVTFFRMSLGGQSRSMASQFGIGYFAGLVMWFFVWLQVRDKEEYQKQINWLSISAIIVGLASLVSFTIPASKLPLLWPKDNPILSINGTWSITGSLLGEIVLFLFLGFEWARKLAVKLKNRAEFNEYFKEALIVAFLGLIMLLGIYKLVKFGWNYLDGTSSWVVAVETLKNGTSAVLGVGIGNFVEAFTKFRPASFNNTKLWGNSFGVSSAGFLQWWTELGLVGLLIIVAISVMIWKKRKEDGFGRILILGLLVLLTPPTFLTVFLFFWTLAGSWGELKEMKLMLVVGESGVNIMPYLVSLLLITFGGFCGYKMVRISVADYFWRESVLASTKNDGSTTYSLQIKAIAMNPTMADYRAMYAQTNLALAQNFLNVKEGEEISQENKEKASTLVQQAVREGQAAVNLDQGMSVYWANLARIYKSLVGLVEDTLNWSVQSYQQAAILDPVNPTINMELGSLMYGAESYDLAERYFEEAVRDKADLANIWYNWAYAAKKQNKLQDAVSRLEQALKLVPADSTDYQKANEELTTWKKELDEAVKKYNEQVKQQKEQQSKKTDETLKTPDKLPTGNDDQIDVSNKDLAPPSVTPTE